MDSILPVLTTALFQLPLVITFVVGFVLAAIRHSKHPRVSRLAMIGFGGLALQTLIVAPLNLLLTMTLSGNGAQVASIGATVAGVSLCASAFAIVWWSCIIAAVFVGRTDVREG